jgi:hypothetical protein
MSRIFSGAEPGPRLTWTAMARHQIHTTGRKRVALHHLAHADETRCETGRGPTEALVKWGAKFYAYSVIAHVRNILESIAQLAIALD